MSKELNQCPFEKACKCAMDEPCEGCETFAEHNNTESLTYFKRAAEAEEKNVKLDFEVLKLKNCIHYHKTMETVIGDLFALDEKIIAKLEAELAKHEKFFKSVFRVMLTTSKPPSSEAHPDNETFDCGWETLHMVLNKRLKHTAQSITLPEPKKEEVSE